MTNTTDLKSISVENLNLKIVNPHTEKQIWNMITWSKNDLIHNTSYLASNYHGDHAYPQMVICGESLKHNIKIAEFLRNNRMWKKEDPLLFTEDLLNMKHSLVSIYALTEDNSQIWYALPENINLSQEAAS